MTQTLSRTLKHSLIALMAIGLLSSLPLHAAENNQAPSAEQYQREGGKRQHRKERMQRIQEVVIAYKLEKGDITQAEVDGMKAERQARRQEMQQLKASGDEDAIDAKRKEFRTAMKAQRKEMKAYLEANPELKERLKTARKAMRKENCDKLENA